MATAAWPPRRVTTGDQLERGAMRSTKFTYNISDDMNEPSDVYTAIIEKFLTDLENNAGYFFNAVDNEHGAKTFYLQHSNRYIGEIGVVIVDDEWRVFSQPAGDDRSDYRWVVVEIAIFHLIGYSTGFYIQSRDYGDRADLLGQLTDRQVNVMRLLAQDKTAAEIAKTLYASERSIRRDLDRLAELGIYEKRPYKKND